MKRTQVHLCGHFIQRRLPAKVLLQVKNGLFNALIVGHNIQVRNKQKGVFPNVVFAPAAAYPNLAEIITDTDARETIGFFSAKISYLSSLLFASSTSSSFSFSPPSSSLISSSGDCASNCDCADDASGTSSSNSPF